MILKTTPVQREARRIYLELWLAKHKDDEGLDPGDIQWEIDLIDDLDVLVACCRNWGVKFDGEEIE